MTACRAPLVLGKADAHRAASARAGSVGAHGGLAAPELVGPATQVALAHDDLAGRLALGG
jgi:hypothetical protein